MLSLGGGNAVTVYLCKDMVPFQNVARKGYKEMVKTLRESVCACDVMRLSQINNRAYIQAYTVYREAGIGGTVLLCCCFY